MSVDLSKCKVGDVLERRDGAVVTLCQIDHNTRVSMRWLTSDSFWHRVGGDTPSVDECWDIIRVIDQRRPKSESRVAKCRITDDFERGLIFSIDSFGINSWPYTTRKNAIRGARRFCKRIGFECEIVK